MRKPDTKEPTQVKETSGQDWIVWGDPRDASVAADIERRLEALKDDESHS